MSRKANAEMIENARLVVINFLEMSGVKPDAIGVSKLEELIEVYLLYGFQGVNDYVDIDTDDDGGVLIEY